MRRRVPRRRRRQREHPRRIASHARRDAGYSRARSPVYPGQRTHCAHRSDAPRSPAACIWPTISLESSLSLRSSQPHAPIQSGARRISPDRRARIRASRSLARGDPVVSLFVSKPGGSRKLGWVLRSERLCNCHGGARIWNKEARLVAPPAWCGSTGAESAAATVNDQQRESIMCSAVPGTAPRQKQYTDPCGVVGQSERRTRSLRARDAGSTQLHASSRRLCETSGGRDGPGNCRHGGLWAGALRLAGYGNWMICQSLQMESVNVSAACMILGGPVHAGAVGAT